VIVPDDSAQAAAVLKLLPPSQQHRWFRSMKSSQALALSVFGNLKILNRADCLAKVQDEDGFGPAFRNGVIGSEDLELEYDVTSLNEIRATSVDLFVSGPPITCVECKLSEVEVGCCSRPALKKEHNEYCTGSYVQQKARSHRCVLAERGMTYWDHIPHVLKWDVSSDHSPCPLAAPYQLVRNVLAASVENGQVLAGRGHALLVFDARNPAFQPRPGGTVETLREQMHDLSMLRRCSWQSILSVMQDRGSLQWLVTELGRKYGLHPRVREAASARNRND